MDGCSILLVDDNPHDVELTLTALEAGAEPAARVRVVNSGPEALAYLRQTGPDQQPDLVLLDLNMPHMNGIEVLDAIRAQDHTRNLPVVILTTSGEESDRRASYEHGASDYVVKALDLGQFFESVGRVLSFYRSARRSPGLI